MAEAGQTKAIERGGFLLFLALVSAAMLAVVWPFVAPLLWATLAAIMFQPLYQRMLAWRKGRENQAAILSLLVITVAVIIPSIIIGSMVVDEAVGVFTAFREGRIDVAGWLDQVIAALPASVQSSLTESGFGNLAAVTERAQEFAEQSVGLIARHALAIGGGVFGWVLAFGVGLYVTFFLLRDGKALAPRVLAAMPMDADITARMAERFLTIVRATIKGSVVVGLVQGALGGITFWIAGVPSAILFAVIMAICSLLPALGPALVWVPAAIYLLAIGEIWQGVLVIVSGVAVIGMADNVLRPILVGRDTGIPDWMILVTTLGGIAALGLSGIVLGPLVAGLFIAAWKELAAQREAEIA
ncbi:AI-2E family transporter [Alteraurantiacibacter aquimixticola]|uniref:AI-2E family transporter n=1 Tax=Alteraurantiacibacter aquimixticola TaxID=2489173 RepID=A0A4T3F2R0_9SPHN|nr:AI-2E family transporter [Alteraurantiacibacter aquimixticola]TIX48900.1 AI-2E family transporter [Alteraurantiacibacter aquimixticola]